jgi:repressor LexA
MTRQETAIDAVQPAPQWSSRSIAQRRCRTQALHIFQFCQLTQATATNQAQHRIPLIKAKRNNNSLPARRCTNHQTVYNNSCIYTQDATMIKLTARQEQVLQLIKRYIEDTGYPPTRADIAGELGFKSANAAEEHLKALARKGAIEIIPGASRGIRIPDMQSGIPVVGLVAAGAPILAVENVEEHCEVPATLFTPRADFFLRVRGDSMIDVGIFEDDLLAVHRTQDVHNGQIVVARVEDEVTVKRLRKGRSKYQIELLPENKDYEPIKVDLREQSFAIEGLSVGVIRR